MKLKNKRAQAGVISIILIIMIVLVAITILWNVFYPMISGKSKQIDVSSLSINLDIKEIVLFSNGAIKLTIVRNSGKGDIGELRFVFHDLANSFIEAKNNDIPKELETKTYFFSPIKGLESVKSVSVFPVSEGKIGREYKSGINSIFKVPKGLVSWWRFEGDLQDFNGINLGNAVGNVNFVDERNGKVLSLQNGYIDFGNNSLGIKNNFAISFWVKTSNFLGFILRKGEIPVNYQISLDSNGRLNFSYYSSGILKSVNGVSSIDDEKWHHVIVTNLAIYVDGNIDNSEDISNLDLNSNNLFIGEGFSGYVDEVMIFNESLSNIEARAIFDLQK